MEQNDGDRLERVEAVSHIRRLPGGSQAHLITTSDGHCCVVKFSNNPQGRRTLVNEVIAYLCAKRMGASTPRLCVVNLSDSFLASNPRLRIDRGNTTDSIPPGIHLGSRYAASNDMESVYDRLPSALIPWVSNVKEFLGALVLDKLMANMDSRQAVFIRQTRKRCGAFRAQIIDHGLMFGGASWSFSDSPLLGVYIDRNVYTSVRSMADFEPWIHLANTVLDERFLCSVPPIVPDEWIANDCSELEHLLERVLMRRRKLHDLILDVHASPSSPFANWNSSAAS